MNNDDITRESVNAALSVLDKHFPDGKKSKGPLGDVLAGKLHEVIEKALEQHSKTS